MDNIINDVIDLKEAIKKSKEYINYKKSLEKIKNNKEINDLVDKIKKLQKEIVKKESKKLNTESENATLSILFSKLFKIKEYNNYVNDSKKLNELLSKVQYNFTIKLNDILN